MLKKRPSRRWIGNRNHKGDGSHIGGIFMMSKWRIRLGYGMGDLGCNLVFSTMASYLMVFYTDVFGIAAAAAGTMMLVTKFIDAMTDTMMGYNGPLVKTTC